VKRRPLIVSLLATMIVVVAAASVLAAGLRPVLGLDLQGGISAVYQPVLPEGAEIPDDFEAIIDETIEIIRSRVDALGVAEPDIARSGTDVIVQLPGVTDAERLRELIGRTAQLRFRPVLQTFTPGTEAYEETGLDCTVPVADRPELAADESGFLCGPTTTFGEGELAVTLPATIYLVGPAALSGESIRDAFPVEQSGGFTTSVSFDAAGSAAFAAITSDLACERDLGRPGLLAIVLDGVVESAPSMNPDVRCGTGLTDGAVITSGAVSREEQRIAATDLALVLRTGSLPISLQPSSFEQVSATLGEASLRAGLLAGGIGLALVGIWLLVFYGWLGLVALAALAVFGTIVVGLIAVLGLLGFALTLAGVAGIIVSIGITADSSILFIERMRDELGLGKTVRSATVKAYASAFRTNLAGNTVTFAAAVILYTLAVGPVRGFALMLGLASVLDIVILAGFTRPVVMLMVSSGFLDRRRLGLTERPITKPQEVSA
jgi:protein-export membrane protein SecD